MKSSRLGALAIAALALLATPDCQPEHCFNDQLDPDETDVDCGAACSPCSDGLRCNLATDCVSGFCSEAEAPESPSEGGGGAATIVTDGVCAPCFADEDCEPTKYCGVFDECQEKLVLAEACLRDAMCQSDFCIDGFCCEESCGGTCQSCNLPEQIGLCRTDPEGTDPAEECYEDDVCNGAGSCRCEDAVRNGTETDVDCGGADCARCGNGQKCLQDGDCISSLDCLANDTCGPP